MVKIMMKDDTIKELNWYDDIPRYIWHTLIFFWTYGYYQWYWIMVSSKDDTIYLWRWWYGSCCWCDSFIGWEGYSIEERTKTQKEWDEFVYAYSPEVEYNIGDITEDILFDYIKKQKMSEEYKELTDKECRKIAKDINNFL
jgi:hypothetical protein